MTITRSMSKRGSGPGSRRMWAHAAPAVAQLALRLSISHHHAAPLLGARRRPQFVRDWKPVWEQYQRYQTLRMEVSDGQGVELNGGEAAKAAFV